MSNFLSVNDLIQLDSDGNKIERILWISGDRSLAYVINIYMEDALPIPKEIPDIEMVLTTGSGKKVIHDPLVRIFPENLINDRDKSFRNRIWEMVSPLLNPENEPDIFIRDQRGKLVNEIIGKYKLSTRTIYKYLRWYWQRGKNKNAFLPSYKSCGGKGREKKLGSKKTGRPRKSSQTSGVNVSETTKKIFGLAASKYFHNRKENAFKAVYELMLKEFFTQKVILPDGSHKIELLPKEQLPTEGQFRYWYEKEKDIKAAIRSRKGPAKFELDHRAVLGKSDFGIMGPGAKYQIDATVGDIYLVSRFNRNWIIGRPVIYIVIDVFSRMIVGIYVGLEGPSWAGAMMALTNAASDKVKFCSEYGITISSEDWPCRHIPECILGDRGEMEGKMVETLINSLHVRIENTPPYRADWKGIVEQYFRTINTTVKPFLPGFVRPDFKERGGKDYRLDATLDLFQLTQIIIQCAIYHNNKHRMDSYEMDETMIADGIRPIPNEIWNWGIVNKSGRLRSFPEDIVKLNLMPADLATITPKGLKFKQMYYCCNTALKDMWFETARNKGNWKVDISYDPRNVERIYLREENGKSYEECFLLDWQEKYMGKTMDEVVYLFETEHLQKEKYMTDQLQAKLNLSAEIERIVSEAEKLGEQQQTLSSKSERLKGIRQNRKTEKLRNRENEAFILGKNQGDNLFNIRKESAPDISPINTDKSSRTLDLIRKKLEERLNEKGKS